MARVPRRARPSIHILLDRSFLDLRVMQKKKKKKTEYRKGYFQTALLLFRKDIIKGTYARGSISYVSEARLDPVGRRDTADSINNTQTCTGFSRTYEVHHTLSLGRDSFIELCINFRCVRGIPERLSS